MRINRLRLFLTVAVGILAALHSYSSRYQMSPDGIAYFDVGSALMRGDWSHAISTYWSPVYPWLLGALVKITGAQGLAQFAVAHVLNFAIFIVNLWIFDRFCREIVRKTEGSAEGRRLAVPVLIVAYLFFAAKLLPMLQVVTPDLLLGTFILAVGYAFWKFAFEQRDGWLILAGVLLGFGYLVKAVLLPVGLATLIVTTVSLKIQRRSLKPVLGALLALALISTPLVLTLSIRAGHLTSGESGRLTYWWSVSNPTRFTDGLLYPLGTLVSSNPRIYKLETVEKITFFPWFDPAASFAKVGRSNFNVVRQIEVLARNLNFYRKELIIANAFLLSAILALLALGHPKRLAPNFVNLLPLFAFVLFALFAYALVLIEGRYTNVFEVLMWLALLGIAAREVPSEHTTIAVRVAFLAVVLLTVQSLPSFVSYVMGPFQPHTLPEPGRAMQDATLEHEKVARALRNSGALDGQMMAVVGTPFETYWAKLVNGSISTYIPADDVNKLCQPGGDPDPQTLANIRETGAQWIVASVPPSTCAGWWSTVPGTRYAIHRLE